jgi:hypothetical protein
LRWWLAFLAGTLTLWVTGDVESATRIFGKLFEGASRNGEQVS